MRKYVLALACLILLAGCSADDGGGSGISGVDEYFAMGAEEVIIGGDALAEYAGYAQDGAAWDWTDYESGRARDWGGVAPEAEFDIAEGAAAPPADGHGYEQMSVIQQQRQIIRNAQVRMEVDSISIAYNNILATAARLGGFEASRTLTYGERNSGFVSAVIRLPANMFDAFLREIEEVGRIVSSNISSEDITSQYFAAAIRLGNLERTLERYYEFLARADNIQEQLLVQRDIDGIIWEIEQITGNLNRWGALVAYSDVSIDLRRLPDPEPCRYCEAYPCECVHYEYCGYCGAYPCECVPCDYCREYPCECEEPRRIIWTLVPLDEMGFDIMQGFASTLSAIARAAQRFITWFISGSPVLVPVIIIIIIAVRRRLRKHNLTLKALFASRLKSVFAGQRGNNDDGTPR